MKMEITTKIDYKYLMNKTKSELAYMVLDLLDKQIDWETVLIPIYKRDYSSARVVAQLCDEILDKSGGLLGRLRNNVIKGNGNE